MRRLRISDDRTLRIREEIPISRSDAKKPALVCVHGAGASSVVFMDLVRRFAPKRHIVALDLPGHGQSDLWHPLPEVSIAMYRDAVGTVCKLAGIERAILVGHSMGGLIALDCVQAWPERVVGCALLASAPVLRATPQVIDLFANSPSEELDGWLWAPETPREIVSRWRGLVVTAEPDVTRADFAALNRFSGTLPSPGKLGLLAILGERDLLVEPFDNAVRLPRSGHMPLLEEAEETFEQLTRWLQSL